MFGFMAVVATAWLMVVGNAVLCLSLTKQAAHGLAWLAGCYTNLLYVAYQCCTAVLCL